MLSKISDAITKGSFIEVEEYLKLYPKELAYCELAATIGNLEMLMYLHENGCPWNYQTIDAAAQNGHIYCMKYAIKNGCPIDTNDEYATTHKDDFICVESYGTPKMHLECLIYAHKSGCFWGSDTTLSAVQNNRLDCLKYAYENGCPIDKEGCLTIAEYRLCRDKKYSDITTYLKSIV